MNPLSLMGGGGGGLSTSSSSASGDAKGSLENNLGQSSTFAVVSGRGNSLQASSAGGGSVSDYLPWIIGGVAVLLAVVGVVALKK